MSLVHTNMYNHPITIFVNLSKTLQSLCFSDIHLKCFNISSALRKISPSFYDLFCMHNKLTASWQLMQKRYFAEHLWGYSGLYSEGSQSYYLKSMATRHVWIDFVGGTTQSFSTERGFFWHFIKNWEERKGPDMLHTRHSSKAWYNAYYKSFVTTNMHTRSQKHDTNKYRHSK